MSEISAIEWLHTIDRKGQRHPGHTYNHWSGCDEVSGGCDHCYARNMPPSMRRGAEWGADSPRVRCSEAYAVQPLVWARKAAALDVRQRVFAHSTSDWAEARDDLDPWREELFAIVDTTPELDWLMLTKRAQEIMRRTPARWRQGFPGQVWVGVTAESRATTRQRLRHLAEVPAAVRFVSYEPAIQDITDELVPYLRDGTVRWVICGGESKAGARPMNPEWARRVRDACGEHGAAFFFKQWGENAPLDQLPEDARRVAIDIGARVHNGGVGPDGRAYGADWLPRIPVYRVGKKAAGRQLDGRTHDAAPRPAFGVTL